MNAQQAARSEFPTRNDAADFDCRFLLLSAEDVSHLHRSFTPEQARDLAELRDIINEMLLRVQQ